MKSKSLITALIAGFASSTGAFAFEQLNKLRSEKYHDRSKGKGKQAKRIRFNGNAPYSYTPGKNPYQFNRDRENNRRLARMV